MILRDIFGDGLAIELNDLIEQAEDIEYDINKISDETLIFLRFRC